MGERKREAVMKKRGRGIACMWYPIGFTVAANPSAAVVKVNEDGTATLLTGTVETGQGSLTILAQIVAANPSAAVVKVNEHGTATLLTGTVETGQGSLTILAQIVAANPSAAVVKVNE